MASPTPKRLAGALLIAAVLHFVGIGFGVLNLVQASTATGAKAAELGRIAAGALCLFSAAVMFIAGIAAVALYSTARSGKPSA
jgi:hypothetical protein